MRLDGFDCLHLNISTQFSTQRFIKIHENSHFTKGPPAALPHHMGHVELKRGNWFTPSLLVPV